MSNSLAASWFDRLLSSGILLCADLLMRIKFRFKLIEFLHTSMHQRVCSTSCVPVACGGPPASQKHDIHLTLHVGPRLQRDYQISSLTTLITPSSYAYITITKPYCTMLCQGRKIYRAAHSCSQKKKLANFHFFCSAWNRGKETYVIQKHELRV